MSHEKRITKLSAHVVPIAPDDSMPVAARKILLEDFIEMLSREAGSRSGDDIEDVHKMRVAIRQMRSALRMFAEYFDARTIKPFNRGLRNTARALGEVRDLDVMIADLNAYKQALSAEEATAVDGIVTRLTKARGAARSALLQWLNSKDYRRFVRAYSSFLTSKRKGAVKPLSPVQPFEVRHVAPLLFQQHLATVRAYDTLIANNDADADRLHALRIECKRLRYAVMFFRPLLGSSVDDYLAELKSMQDYLGRLNDVIVAHSVLDDLRKLTSEQKTARDNYLAKLEAEADERVENFAGMWNRFNTRTVQTYLQNGLLVLR